MREFSSLEKMELVLTAADRAMVAVIDLLISKDAFEEYEVKEEKEVGLNMTNFLSLIEKS